MITLNVGADKFRVWISYSYFKKVHLWQLTISSRHFLVGVTANPPNYDYWKWSTDKGALF